MWGSVRRRGGLVLGLALMASGCVCGQESPAGTAAAPTEAPKQASKPASNVRRAIEWKRLDYTCEGEAKLTVYLRNEMVKVSFQNKVYLMKQVISGSGTRYSDGKVVWWSKGEGGFLQEDAPDGDGKMIVKDCELNQSMNAGAASHSVKGTVSYLVRMALPSEAVIQVRLQDVSLSDAPATTIAEEKITLGQRQVPVPFELKYDPAKIDPKHTYSVNAWILVDGQLRFINDQSYRVLTQGNPSHIEVVVKPVITPVNSHP